MPKQNSYEYFIIRAVPLVEREEFINVGAIVYCREKRFLGIKLDMDLKRLSLLNPKSDLDVIRDHLSVMKKVAQGDDTSKVFKSPSFSERFNWLAAKSSTIIQTSDIHSGLCQDPQQALDDLFKKSVQT